MKKSLKKSIALVVAIVMVLNICAINNTQVQAATKYTIKVNLGTNCTTIYKNGKAIKAMICSPSSETPTGTFYIPVKYRWHDMIGNCYAQYCSRITDGILFHSVWYYKKGDKSSMSVSAYNVMGQKASHGCVRLLCKDAKWIYDHCPVGTKISIFWGKKSDDPLPRPSFTPIRNGKHTDWDPTDPDPNNPYRKAEPKIIAKTTKIEYKAKVKAIDLVTIKSSTGSILTKKNASIKTKGKINTKKLGKYKIKYIVKDSFGNKKTKTITFKVVDTKKPQIKGAKSKSNVAMGSTVNLLNGVRATAVSGKNLTSKIKVSVKYKNKAVKVSKGFVTFNKTGSYKVKYSVKGTNKKTKTKIVTYKVTDQRVKFSLKCSTVKIKQGDKFNPYSYVKDLKTYKGTAISVSKYVKYSGKVDTSKPGTYTVTYTAQYKEQKYTKRTAVLKVIVEAAEQPTTKPEETTPVEQPTTTPEE